MFVVFEKSPCERHKPQIGADKRVEYLIVKIERLLLAVVHSKSDKKNLFRYVNGYALPCQRIIFISRCRRSRRVTRFIRITGGRRRCVAVVMTPIRDGRLGSYFGHQVIVRPMCHIKALHGNIAGYFLAADVECCQLEAFRQTTFRNNGKREVTRRPFRS